MSPTPAPNVPVHCHVDPAIDRHGEPHVVRVGVESILIIPSCMLITPILRKYFIINSAVVLIDLVGLGRKQHRLYIGLAVRLYVQTFISLQGKA